MRRREALRRGVGAVGCATALCGCVQEAFQETEREPAPLEDRVRPEEVDLPVRQRLQIAAEAIEEAAGAGIDDLDAFGSYLEDAGLVVEVLEAGEATGESIVSLEYVAAEFVEEGFIRQLGLVAGGYAALVAANVEGEKLEASLLDPGARKFGEFEVRRHWAEEYEAGALTAREYADEVAVTAESAT